MHAHSNPGVLDLVDHLRARGMFLPRREFLRAGFSDSDIRAALAAKRIFRVRQGWFGVPDASADAVAAVRIGGRLTGEAALRSYGIWTRPGFKPEIVVRPNANELRRPTSRTKRLTDADRKTYRIRWSDDATRGSDLWRVPLKDAVLHLLRTSERDIVIPAIDSALNRASRGEVGLTMGEIDEIFAEAPARVRGWRKLVDGRAEAGGETILRLICHDNGIPFEPQVDVPGVGRLDGQIGPNTFVEADGAAWHDNEQSFHRDRERDIASAMWGHRTLRFSYPLLTDHEDWCVRAMLVALSQDPGLTRPTEKRGSLA